MAQNPTTYIKNELFLRESLAWGLMSHLPRVGYSGIVKRCYCNFSLEGIITNWNKGAEQDYGYTAQEI
jgi:hypothetical protein